MDEHNRSRLGFENHFHDFTRMNTCRVDRSAEQLDEAQQPMPAVEQEKTEVLAVSFREGDG